MDIKEQNVDGFQILFSNLNPSYFEDFLTCFFSILTGFDIRRLRIETVLKKTFKLQQIENSVFRVDSKIQTCKALIISSIEEF